MHRTLFNVCCKRQKSVPPSTGLRPLQLACNMESRLLIWLFSFLFIPSEIRLISLILSVLELIYVTQKEYKQAGYLAFFWGLISHIPYCSMQDYAKVCHHILLFASLLEDQVKKCMLIVDNFVLTCYNILSCFTGWPSCTCNREGFV